MTLRAELCHTSKASLKTIHPRVSVCLPVAPVDRHHLWFALQHLPTHCDEVIILLDCGHGSWKHHIAEAFETVFQHASGDVLLSYATDMLVSPHLVEVGLHYIQEGYDLVSFQYRDYTLNKHCQWHETYMNLLRKLPFLYRCKLGKWSGLFMMTREVWETIHYQDTPSPDLQFFKECAEHGFTHKYVTSLRNYHLRSGTLHTKQIEQGRTRFLLQVHPLKVIAHSLLYLKPYLLIGYLRAICGSS
jgi:hypothetical protein